MPVSAQRLITGLVRKASVAIRITEDWMGSNNLRDDFFASPYIAVIHNLARIRLVHGTRRVAGLDCTLLRDLPKISLSIKKKFFSLSQ